MKILGITDLLLPQDLLEKGINIAFPEAEIRFLHWSPDSREILSKENLNIEKNGPESATPVNGLLETVKEFDPEVIIAHFAPVTKKVIENAGSLEIIGCLRGGVENVNLEAATKKNIMVFNNSGRTANAVAEFALAHMLSLSRNIAVSHHAMMKGKWWRPQPPVNEMYGSTIGLVGFGSISRKLTERLQGFKVEILTYDPYVTDSTAAAFGAKRVALTELLKASDFVSLHCRMTAETKNIIGTTELNLMKPTAYLINTARADLINKTALINALKAGKIRGVALDVFWQEPPAKDDPIFQFRNISFTPHLAGATDQTIWYGIWLFVEALQDFLNTRQSHNIVNFQTEEQIKIAAAMKLIISAGVA